MKAINCPEIRNGTATPGKCPRVLATIAVATFLGLSACSVGKAAVAVPVEKAVLSVKTIAASHGTVQVETEFAAQIRASEDLAIAPKIAGRLASVNVKVGQVVRKGQLLFTIESREYDAQYRQVMAAAKAANANVDRTSGSAQSFQIIQAESAVSQAQVGYDDAVKLYDRTKKLVDSGVAARQGLDGATAKLDSARSQLASAKENLKLTQASGGKQATDVVSAQAEQAQASVDIAKSQLDACTITSMLNGVVTARMGDPGMLVSAGMPIIVVMDASAVTADLNVPENLISGLRQGDQFQVMVPAVSTTGFTGIIDSIAPAADVRTLGFPVKIRIENAIDSLKPGMFARVRLVVARAEGVLFVPNSAVIMENGVDYLWVIDNHNKASRHSVVTGLADAAHTEIKSGLNEQELVISEGQAFLNEGDPVSAAK